MGDVWEFTTAAPMRPGRAAYAPPASGAPIVVDFGSHHCRAGWAGHAAPLVDFRALSLPDGSQIVGDYDPRLLRGVDPGRSRVASPFDGPVPVQLDAAEAVLDHALRCLGLPPSRGGLLHPVLLTEALLCPPSARARLAELLLEGYGAPAVAFGADAAFAWAGSAAALSAAPSPSSPGGGGPPPRSGVVCHLGHSATTLLPFCGGCPVASAAVRLPLGGLALTEALAAALSLAPDGGSATFARSFGGAGAAGAGLGPFGRAEEAKHALCHVAADYGAEARAYAAALRALAAAPAGAAAAAAAGAAVAGAPAAGRVARLQLPWSPAAAAAAAAKRAAAEPSAEAVARREASARANGERLRAMAAARRLARAAEREAERDALRAAAAAAAAAEAAGDGAAAAAALAAVAGGGYESARACAAAAAAAARDARRLRGDDGPPDPADAAAVAERAEEDALLAEPPPVPDEVRYPLLNVPDCELGPDDLRAKRRQRLLKGGDEARARQRAARAAAAEAEAAQAASDAAAAAADPSAFVASLRAERAAVIARRDARRRGGGGGGGGEGSDARRRGATPQPGAAAAAAAPLTAAPQRRGGEVQRERMRLMAQAIGGGGDGGDGAATGPPHPKRARGRPSTGGGGGGGDDDPGFGDDADDWAVYRAIDAEAGGAGGGGSDSEADREADAALARLSARLAEHAPGAAEEEAEAEDAAWGAALAGASAAAAGLPRPFLASDPGSAEAHQLFLSTERIRVPELLFAPEGLAGSAATCGLGEALRVLLSRCPRHARAALLQQPGGGGGGGAPMVVTGGGALLPGLGARLAAEAEAACAQGAAFKVVLPDEPRLAAWRGASARAGAAFAGGGGGAGAMTRAQWAEEGPSGLARRVAQMRFCD